jgi:hypothetical protein
MRYLAGAVFGFLLVIVMFWALAMVTKPSVPRDTQSPSTRIIPLPPLIPHQTSREKPARPQVAPHAQLPLRQPREDPPR